MQFRIVLDIDGVLADFVGGICEAHGRKNPYPKAIGWDVNEHLDMSERDFWEPAKNEFFWSGLSWTQDAHEIFSLAMAAVGESNVFYMTSPPPAELPGGLTLNRAFCAGRLSWFSRRFPKAFKNHRLIIGQSKYMCAKPGQILIDDADHNIDAYHANDGVGILVPRPWNTRRDRNTLDTLTKEIWEVVA